MNVILQSRDRAACSDKTLYISDLDGTLLRLDETVSAFTAETVNRLEAEGILFSYATARSYLTASKVTAGITARLPVIVYNGAFIIDSGTEGNSDLPRILRRQKQRKSKESCFAVKFSLSYIPF